ncbi:Uncharacterised protein [uncultured archaeon]|nr:Uncharacterised protein [uncultured archaeon]
MSSKRADGRTLTEFVESDEFQLEKLYFVRGYIQGPTEKGSEYHFTLNYYSNLPELSIFCEDPGGDETVFQRFAKCTGIEKLAGNHHSIEVGIEKPNSKKEIAEFVEKIFEEFNKPLEFRHIVIDYNSD